VPASLVVLFNYLLSFDAGCPWGGDRVTGELPFPLGVPTPARIYDYGLGGKDNFEIDREAAQRVAAVLAPEMAPSCIAWENRRFLWRAVEYMANAGGIDQFIDVGAGLPTMRNTHEIAQEARPGARVVYVDNDPMVLSHGRALLGTATGTAIVTADAQDPGAILGHPDTQALIDFRRPVGLLFVAVLHFVPSPGHPRYVAGQADPRAILAAFRDHVAPGSQVAVSHVTQEGPPAEAVERTEEVYAEASAPMVFRTREEVAALFDGWRLIPPGVVRAWQWRSGPDESPHTPTLWAGVGVKPD
jgi:hypothetical protein